MENTLKGNMKWIGVPMMYDANSIFARWRMRMIRKRAKRAWRASGMQHHIIPAGPNAVVIVNNQWRKSHNKLNKKSKLDVNLLLKKAIYSTSNSERLIK